MATKGTIGGHAKQASVEKKTSQGSSKNSRPASKNDRANKKSYRGQGR
jgi:hypothetical protein